MKLLLFRSLWGMDQPWEKSFPQLKKLGYHGIEMWLPPKEERARFRALLQKHKLAFIADIFTGGRGVREHLASFKEALAEVKAFGVEPKCVNSHSGSDAWDEKEGIAFFKGALVLEKKAGLNVLHETNRGRILFHPRPALRMLKRFKGLKLTCDFSHWVCVTESLLDEKSEVLKACAQHAVHVNARVGYEEGIQVSDPRAPEYQRHLLAHERWWSMIWKAQKARGMKESYLTAEFGPPPYGQAMPYTKEPLADLDEICDWQAKRQAKRFAVKFK